jgi:hypothetical protein
MEVTFAVRHIGEVVVDVLSGARDPDGDIVVEQKAGAGDQVPLGAPSIVNLEYCRADLVVAVRNTNALLRVWLLKGDADAARGVRHQGG